MTDTEFCGFVLYPALGHKCSENTRLVLVTNHTGYNEPVLTRWPRCEDHLGQTIIDFLARERELNSEYTRDHIWFVERV